VRCAKAQIQHFRCEPNAISLGTVSASTEVGRCSLLGTRSWADGISEGTMKWFQHISNASQSEQLQALLDELGPAGYGMYWLIVEKIAEKLDHKMVTKLSYPKRKWARICQVSVGKLTVFCEKLTEIGQDLEKPPLLLSENNGKYLSLDCPKLLGLLSEGAKKAIRKYGQSPDKVRPPSGHPPDIQDITLHNKTRQDKTEHKSKSDRVQELVDLYHEILPELPIVQKLDSKQPRYRAALARLKEHPVEPPEHSDESWWETIFYRVKRAPHLMGKNDRGWTANFEWIMNPTNLQKIIEGNYDDRKAAPTDYGPEGTIVV